MGYYENRKAKLAEEYRALGSITKAKLEKEVPRKEVTQEHNISYLNTFTKIVEEAKEFAKKWKKSINDVMMDHHYTEEYGSYSSEVHLEVAGLETDEQYYSRVMEHYEAVRTREEHDRKEFDRLRAKYDK